MAVCAIPQQDFFFSYRYCIFLDDLGMTSSVVIVFTFIWLMHNTTMQYHKTKWKWAGLHVFTGIHEHVYTHRVCPSFLEITLCLRWWMHAALAVPISLSLCFLVSLAFFELTTFCVFQVPDVCQMSVLVFTRTFTEIYHINNHTHVTTSSTVSKCYEHVQLKIRNWENMSIQYMQEKTSSNVWKHWTKTSLHKDNCVHVSVNQRGVRVGWVYFYTAFFLHTRGDGECYCATNGKKAESRTLMANLSTCRSDGFHNMC